MVKEQVLHLALDTHALSAGRCIWQQMARGTQDRGASREVDRSLVGWGQDDLGFIAVLPTGTFPPGIMRRKEKRGGKDHFQVGFDIIKTNSLWSILYKSQLERDPTSSCAIPKQGGSTANPPAALTEGGHDRLLPLVEEQEGTHMQSTCCSAGGGDDAHVVCATAIPNPHVHLETLS